MKHFALTAGRRTRAAFSLVETVLALGIMGLAITALLGLLPHGLEMSRKAANSAAEARIIDTIVGKLSNIPFANLPAQNNLEMHFDDQGVEVDGTADLLESTFYARVLVPTGTQGLTLPGSISRETTMRRIQIQIVQTALRRFNFDSAPPKSFTTVPVVLSSMAP